MKKYFILIILIITILLSSCNMIQNINLNNDKSGTSTTEVEIKDFFLTVLKDVATLQENKIDENKSFAKQSEEEFVKNLKDNKNIYDIKTKVLNDNSYIGSFKFKDFDKLFAEMAKNKNQDVVKVTKNSIKINLSIDNYEQIEEMVPELKDPGFETFGPRYNEGVSKEEYYEMLSYILGEDSESEIKNSNIEFIFKTPNPIKTIKNGVKINSNTAKFTIELIDFLLLAKPLVYELTY